MFGPLAGSPSPRPCGQTRGDPRTVAPSPCRDEESTLSETPGTLAFRALHALQDRQHFAFQHVRIDALGRRPCGWRAGGNRGRGHFTRATAPHGDGPLYHHIGLYAYRRAALERFVTLKPSPLEQREKLEQLRLLEAGMRIDVAIVDSVPLGVDTPEDLETARAVLSASKS